MGWAPIGHISRPGCAAPRSDVIYDVDAAHPIHAAAAAARVNDITAATAMPAEAGAETVGRFRGYGSGTQGDPGPWEGELRTMWKPTNHEALWFHGGNLALSRHYSLYVSLQIKARMENIPTPVHGLPPAAPR